MSLSPETQEKAFQLYCDSVGGHVAAKKLGISRQTFYRWRDEYDWKKKKQELCDKINKKNDEIILDRKERQLKIIETGYGSFLKAVKSGDVKVRAGEVKGLMEHELLLAGEATEIHEHRILTPERIKEIYDETTRRPARGKGDKGA